MFQRSFGQKQLTLCLPSESINHCDDQKKLWKRPGQVVSPKSVTWRFLALFPMFASMMHHAPSWMPIVNDAKHLTNQLISGIRANPLNIHSIYLWFRGISRSKAQYASTSLSIYLHSHNLISIAHYVIHNFFSPSSWKNPLEELFKISPNTYPKLSPIKPFFYMLWSLYWDPFLLS